jgi:PTH2 family peptidyl-tRNA hydrolase
MKQLIIARKDLNMSPGKLAAQVSHASMAFLTNAMRTNYKKVLECDALPSGKFLPDGTPGPRLYRRDDLTDWATEAFEKGETLFYFRPTDPDNPYGKLELCEPTYHYQASVNFDLETWENWICGSFTKIVCEAKNKYQLEKVISIAKNLNLKENIDYFLIKDNCFTELTPEEVDENGIGRTLTCIGFKPLQDDIIHQLSKKYQLYK